MKNRFFTISEIVNKFNFIAEDIINYFEQGLLHATYNEKAELIFDSNEIERIRLASEMQKAGLPINKIASILKERLEFDEESIADSKLDTKLAKLNSEIYRSFFNSAYCLMLIADEQGKILNFNQAFSDKLGYGDEIIGTPFIDLHPDDLKPQAIENLQNMLSGELDFCPLEVLSKTGKRVPVVSTVSVQEVNARKVMFGIARDAEIKDQVYEVINKQKESFRTMFDFNVSGMFVTSIQSGKVISANKSFERITGFSADDMLGKNFSDLRIFKDAEQINYHKEQIYSQGAVENHEIEIYTKCGRLKSILFSGAIIDFTEPSILITINDITAIKRKQYALEMEISNQMSETIKASHLNEAIIQATSVSVVIFDQYGNILKVNTNDDSQSSLILPQHQNQNILEILPELSAITVKQAITKSLSSRLSSNTVIKLNTEDEEKWFSISLSLVGDEENSLVGIIQDVSSITWFSNNYQSSEARFKESFNLSASAMVVINLSDGIISDINNRACEMSGYTKAEIKKMNFSNFSPQCELILDRFRNNKIESNGGENFTTTLYTKEGLERNVDIYLCTREFEGTKKIIAIIYDITNRVQAERALNENRMRLQSLVEESEAGLWDWNIKTRELIYGGSFFNMIGYTRAELEPGTYEKWRELCHPDDLKLPDSFLQRYLAGETPIYECEIRMRHKQGHWIWILERGKVIEFDDAGNPLKLAGIQIEFTERKLAQINLQKRFDIERLLNTVNKVFSNNELSETSKSIDQALKHIGEFSLSDRCYLFKIDNTTGTMSNTNEWCAPSVEPQKETLMNLPLTTFPWWMERLENFQTIYIIEVSAMPPEAIAEQTTLMEQDIQSVLVLPVYTENELLGFIGMDAVAYQMEWLDEDIAILEYVAKLVANNLKMQKIVQDLIDAKDIALESSRIKSEFISNINHEVRTPLNEITNFLELLEITEFSQQVKKFLPSVVKSAYELLEMFNSMIAINRLGSGEITFNIGECNFKQMLGEVLTNYEVEIATKGLKIEIDFEQEQCLQIKCDIDMLRYILNALISNAVKFTEVGSIKITAKIEDGDNTYLLLSVSDTGIGMDRVQLKNLFQRFYQGDEFITKQAQGFGLGLAIVEKIVYLMDGSIEVSSTLGEGTQFDLKIPIMLHQNKEITHAKSCNKNIKVLIVEDNKIIVKMISTLLTKKDYIVFVAENGKMAVDFTLQTKVDVILMDIQMPIMDGLTASRLIKESLDNPNCSTPIIAVSAHLKEGYCESCEWIDGAIPKPVHFPSLFDKINELIASRGDSNSK